MMSPTVEEMAKEFWKRVNRTEGCWLWTGVVGPRGYGVFGLNRKRWRAHRASWIINRGDLPADLFVCHHCDNPKCVRPDHLFLGTAKDNSLDAYKKGRLDNTIKKATAAHVKVRLARTHCKYGHLRTDQNTSIGTKGDRVCLDCKKRKIKDAVIYKLERRQRIREYMKLM